MGWPGLLSHIALPVQGPVPSGRLSDFTFRGRSGPVLAFAVLALGLYVLDGPGLALEVLVKLWVAYAVAFVALATLAASKGVDARWVMIVPVAAFGVALGGCAAAVIGIAPEWTALLRLRVVGPEWAAGAAFSAFFVGLSLVTSAVRRREQRISDAQRQLVEARLQTLTAQIEPHFLMNTLANLRYLIKIDSRAAHEMIDHLADFLEGALERSRDLRSTLREEVQLVESYLSIMRIRFGDRLSFTIDVPSALDAVPFPPLLLQALVENAVTHGIAPSGQPGVISVTAREKDGVVDLTVADTGVGFDPAKSPIHGMGLKNTRERLSTFYEGRASLAIEPGESSGTVARLSVPLTRG